MIFQPKNFNHLLGTQGFSDTLLKNHFALYEGYVKNVNLIAETLAQKSLGNVSSLEYAELKRRFGWEWNGMRLHELYFGNMKRTNSENTNAPMRTDMKLYTALVDQFGSYDNWMKDFKSTGTMRGIGWTILYYDNKYDDDNNKKTGKLFNVWVNEHDMGHLAGATPLLVLDVFEHAYTLDYGLKRADYIDAFWNAIDWETIVKRFGNFS